MTLTVPTNDTSTNGKYSWAKHKKHIAVMITQNKQYYKYSTKLESVVSQMKERDLSSCCVQETRILNNF